MSVHVPNPSNSKPSGPKEVMPELRHRVRPVLYGEDGALSWKNRRARDIRHLAGYREGYPQPSYFDVKYIPQKTFKDSYDRVSSPAAGVYTNHVNKQMGHTSPLPNSPIPFRHETHHSLSTSAPSTQKSAKSSPSS